MAKQGNLEFTGIVIQELGNSMFRVELDTNPDIPALLCTISGKIRKHYIKIIPGDHVKIEVSPYDLTKGRIVTRLPLKGGEENNNSTNKKRK